MDNSILKINQVADFLQVSKFTVYRLIETGKITAFKVGCEWRFKESEIDKYITAQTYKPPSPVNLNGIYRKNTNTVKKSNTSPQKLTMDMFN